MVSRRSIWVFALAALTVVWLSVAVAFGVALSRERVKADCHVIDSTYGERHWQWSPPGTYCVYSSPALLQSDLDRDPAKRGLPFSAALSGWNRPPHSRSVLAIVLLASGIAIGVAWVLRWLQVRAGVRTST